MDWRVKASIQKTLSATRIGDKLNHLGSRLMNPNYMSQKVDYHVNEALIHIDRLARCGYQLSDQDAFLELGTGYAIIEPLVMVLMGINKIVTVDITPDLKFDESIKYIDMLREEHIQQIASRSLLSQIDICNKLAELKKTRDMGDLFEKAGIVYIAPYSIDDLNKFNDQIDVCYSQVVLEHVPESTMMDIFGASREFLRPGGYHSHIVNLTDHFRNPGFFCDKKVTDVNFLRYSDRHWRFWAGNDIAYVNRLRFPFYMNMLSEMGFEVCDVDKQKQPDRMNQLLSYDEIHDDIKGRYVREELMDTLWVQRFHAVCRRPS